MLWTCLNAPEHVANSKEKAFFKYEYLMKVSIVNVMESSLVPCHMCGCGSLIIDLHIHCVATLLGALRHIQSISQLLCVKRRDYGNVSLVRGSDFDLRQLFVHWFL